MRRGTVGLILLSCAVPRLIAGAFFPTARLLAPGTFTLMFYAAVSIAR